MATQCQVEMYREPLNASFEDIESAPLDVFFALGIVNPFGPTLSFVAAVGVTKQGARLPIVHAMLNPFQQRVQQIGQFIVGERWTPERDLAPLIKRDFGGCPTLLLISDDVSEEVREPLATEILATFNEDVVGTYLSVRAFLGDPWQRVTASMRGTATADSDVQDPEEAARRLAPLLLSNKHVASELGAFVAAWRGSIEETRIPPEMKATALTVRRFEEFLASRVLPAVWLPEAPQVEPPIEKERSDLNPQSVDEVRRMIASQDWQELPADNLVRLMQFGLMAYGAEPRTEDIPALKRFCEYAVSKTDPEHRALMTRQLTDVVENSEITLFAFLPILVVEPELSIVATATIDFISCSPYNEHGELRAIAELRDLFRDRALANPGAVFGALVSMGETGFAEFLDTIEPILTDDELDVAARVHTPFLKPTEVSYWLHLANKFAAEGPGTSGQRFGSCALAIALARRDITSDRVIEGQRDFPCRGKANPIRIIRETTVDEYAESIVPELYELEATEAPPKLFSHVLRTWGYEPQALLEEQFFPPSDSTEQEFTRLRKPPLKRD